MTSPVGNVVRAASTLARAALKYAEHGWHVFPLLPRGKHPLIKNGGGFLAATSNTETVAAWWRGQPNANIGLWPGQSGLVVIDVDGPDGEATGRALGLWSEPTLECRTGRADGGRHCYFTRPDFTVSNVAIGHKIDVRGDAGYVILPPSIHPSGKVYSWLGRVEDIRPLPPRVLEALRAAQLRSESIAGTAVAPGESGQSTGLPARAIAFEGEIAAGGRNNTLTRYAGRLLAKGLPDDEVLVLVSAVNQTKCKPPLPQSEINVMVSGLAVREGRKRESVARDTGGGTTIALVQDRPDVESTPSLPTPTALAADQVAKARAILERDVSSAPRWAWSELDSLTGPMLPGDLVIVGSLMGNGKSTLLMSQMDAFSVARVPTLYIPLEVDPEVNRLRWAAWRLGLDVRCVIRQEWNRLGEGAREAVDGVLEEQERNPYMHFAPPKRITLASLIGWCQWAREHVACRVVMLDHLHRMDFGSDASSHRVTVTDVVRKLKDMARELGIVLVAAAQLNRSTDPIDMYTAPLLGRLKESAGIAEEADVVLMLSRKLRRDLPTQWANELKLGRISERALAEPDIMVVTCRKHRLDDDALNRNVLLSVNNGRVGNRPRVYVPTHTAHRWEPE